MTRLVLAAMAYAAVCLPVATAVCAGVALWFLTSPGASLPAIVALR